MNENVVVIGAGGHGKVVADIIKKSGDVMAGFLDDNTQLPEFYAGFKILGTVEAYKTYRTSTFVVAIGNSDLRKKIVNQLKNVKWYTAIHPSAVISDIDVSIAEGTVIMANAVINAGTKIGRHCIINSGAIVEHDNQIEDFVHISVGAKLAGNVHVGEGTWIGIGASISNNLFICSDCMLGAGSVAIKNINEAGTYVGVPVRKV